jgi:hypothetical protein
MAYDSSTLAMVSYAPLATHGRTWIHESADATATVDGAGFITDGGARGMLVGDFVIHTDITASDGDTTMHRVMTVSSTYPGAVNLSEGTVINAGVVGD